MSQYHALGGGIKTVPLRVEYIPIAAGGTGVVTNYEWGDVRYEVDDGIVTEPSYQIVPLVTTEVPVSYASLIPNAQVTEEGYVTRPGEVGGTAYILVSAPGYQSRTIELNMSNDGVGRVDTYLEYIAGSMCEQLNTQWAGIIGGVPGSYDNQHFLENVTLPDPSDPTTYRCDINPNTFISSLGLDYTGICVFTNGVYGELGVAEFNRMGPAPVLVTPRHALVAAHYSGTRTSETFPDPRTHIYKDGDTYHYATVKDFRQIVRPFPPYASEDIGVICYTEDVPANFKRYKVGPPDLDTYAPSGVAGHYGYTRNSLSNLPYIRFAVTGVHDDPSGNKKYYNVQLNAAVSLELYDDPEWSWTRYSNSAPQFLNNIWPSPANTDYSYASAIGGDSGSPSFLYLNGELVFVTSAHTRGSSPYHCGKAVPLINTAMNDMMGVAQGTYSLDVVDMSGLGYPQYDLSQPPVPYTP